MTKKPRFRCPARNEWDRVVATFRAAAQKPGREGAMSRLMLDMMPPMLDAIERERDELTPPHEFFDAVGAVAGALIEEAIEQRTIGQMVGRERHLDQMLHMINRIVRPRITAAKAGRIIIPEY